MTRHAFPAECPRCRAPVLATDWCLTYGLEYGPTRRADPVAIPLLLEQACAILDRPTYGYYERGGDPHIVPRDAAWHHWRPHGDPLLVLPAHVCGLPLPGEPLDLEAATPDPHDADAPCPY